MIKKVIIILLVTFVINSNNAISKGYSFFDTKTEEVNGVLDIGSWNFLTLLIGPDFARDILSFFDNELEIDPSSSLNTIYSQSNIINNKTVEISDINVFGFSWDFIVKGKTKNFSTIGYPVLIDREMDAFGNPVHDINPIYSNTELYEGYNYFTAYDARNLHTDNQYSLRLNYVTLMQTTTYIGKVSNISFYAMSGLSSPSDEENIRNAKFSVSVSSNGTNWTVIATERGTVLSSESEYFDYYSFDVPGNMLGEELFVKISFFGQTFKAGFSRLVIDELIITTLD